MRLPRIVQLSIALWLTVALRLQAQTVSPALRDALLAQVRGPGGCYDLEQVASLSVPYFPAVRFVQGECTREHGDTARPLAAIDSSGQVYVLDSESAFQFLVRQHRPIGLDSLSVVAYTRYALVMMGKLPVEAQLVFDKRQVPDSLARRVKVVRHGLIPSRVDEWVPERRAMVQITAFTSDAVYWTGLAIVSPTTGEVFAVLDEWTESGHRVR